MSHIYNVARQNVDPRDFPLKAVLNPAPGIKLPKSVDLRPYCAPVFDQGSLGSCTANAGAAFMWMIFYSLIEAGFIQQDAVNFIKSDMFSRLFFYYKEREMEGKINEDTGAFMRDIGKVAQQVGVCLEQYMPYIINNFATAPSVEALNNAATFKITAYRSVEGLQGIKECLALKQKPVLMGINIFESFESDAVRKTGIVPVPKSDERNLGGHAVLCVGYEDANGVAAMIRRCKSFALKCAPANMVLCQNSWGENWGDKGFFWLPYDYFTKDYAWDFWTLEK